jgi:ppGpp synthetase/RelA/SpoT-type nucleotidyltranferase
MVFLSGAQVDKLGDRMRRGELKIADLRTLDSYRLSHRPAYDLVVGMIRSELSLEPTGRPGKTTGAILAKLNRQRTRMSQMQDVAGCRVLVADVSTQDEVVSKVLELFPGAQLYDRRAKPSYGYRAVHIVVTLQRRSVEIQIRTRLQHLWAELSEKLADALGNDVKYGGGPSHARDLLKELGELVEAAETLKAENGKFHANLTDVLSRLVEEFSRLGKEKT